MSWSDTARYVEKSAPDGVNVHGRSGKRFSTADLRSLSSFIWFFISFLRCVAAARSRFWDLPSREAQSTPESTTVRKRLPNGLKLLASNFHA